MSSFATTDTGHAQRYYIIVPRILVAQWRSTWTEWWFWFGVTYADNFVLCLESVDDVTGKYDKLEEVLEKKRLYAKYFIS